MEYLSTCREAAIIVGTEQHRALAEVSMDTPKDASSKDALARAVDHCANGEWQQAHEIVQKDRLDARGVDSRRRAPPGRRSRQRAGLVPEDRPRLSGPEAVQAEIAAARRAVHGGLTTAASISLDVLAPMRGASHAMGISLTGVVKGAATEEILTRVFPAASDAEHCPATRGLLDFPFRIWERRPNL
jgi:hypothetical protein